jgi:hypothetical protein
VFQVFFREAHHDGRIHLHEAAVAVVSEAFVAGGAGKSSDRLVVKPKVQNRFHHAGHGTGGTRADADEQRAFRVAKFLAGDLLELLDVVNDLLLQLAGILLAVLVEVIAGFRRDGEARGNGKPDTRHLRESRALATQEVPPFPVAL